MNRPSHDSVWRNRHTGEEVRVRAILDGIPSFPNRPYVEYTNEGDTSLLGPLLAHLAGRNPVWALYDWHVHWEPT